MRRAKRALVSSLALYHGHKMTASITTTTGSFLVL